MREYFPLFCTAQVPPAPINDLLKKSEAGFGNSWTLVKTSSQTTFEKPTEPPVSEFTTSFTSASLDTLGEFCKSHSPDNLTMFAVLDERSVNDSTLLLVKWEVWTDYIDPNATSGLDSDSNREQHEGWQTLRTFFKDAADVMDGLEYLPVREFNSTDKGFDENGVLLPKAGSRS